MSVPPVRLSLSRELKKSRLDRAVRPSFTFERMESRTLLSGVSFLASPVDIPIAGTTALPVVVADLNGDGVADITTATLAQYGTTAGAHRSTIATIIGNGDGTFVAPQTEYTAQGVYTTTASCGAGILNIVSGDVNGDGAADIVIAKDAYAQTGGVSHPPSIEVLTGAGLGGGGRFGGGANGPARVTLTRLQTIPLQSGASNKPGALALGDLNGDGFPDLVVGYAYNNSVAVLVNNGDGSFRAPNNRIPVGNSPDAIAIADLNNDGIADLVVANGGSNTISVLRGIGDGSFLPAQTYVVGSAPSAVQVVDINGDGIPDIITTNAGSNTISVLLGNGNGTFQAAKTFGTGPDPVALTVGDIDGDGKLDVVTANATGDSLSLLLGTGDSGLLQSAQNLPLNASPVSVVAADLSGVSPAGSGPLDLVVSSTAVNTTGSGTVSQAAQIQVLMNTNTNQPGLTESNGIVSVIGTSGNDTIDLSSTGNTLHVVVNNISQDFSLRSIGQINVRGLGGNDSITLETGIPAVLVGGGGGSDTIVALNAANDTLRGGAGNDSISGGTGNNLIIGKAGADTLLAGTGNDTLNGNGGADELTGGSGNDSINGGAGNDTITGFAGGGTDTGIDTLVGNTGDDLVLESPGDLVLGTGGGNDTVTS